MKQKTITETIRLPEVDLSDRTYIFTFEPIMSQMVQSIKEVGLINPPILARISDEPRYRVVSGLKRILAMIHLKKDIFPARIVSESVEKPSIDHFLINFYENLSTRELNVVEKAIALNKLIILFQMEKKVVLKHFTPLLGLGNNPRVLELFVPIIQLEDNIKIALVENSLSPELAIHMLDLSQDDRRAVFSLFMTLKLGKNRQKEFMRLLEDISESTERPIKLIIEQPEIGEIVIDEKLTTSQKAERIRSILHTIRYPVFAEAERHFNDVKKELKLPPHIVLKHSPFFESDKYSIEFSFRNQQEFRDILKRMNEISQMGSLDKLNQVRE